MERYRPSDLARWLRVRRKRRLAEAGQPVSMDDPDFYGDEPPPDTPPLGCLVVIAIAVAVFIIGFLVIRSLGGGEDEEIIGSPPATAADTTGVTTGSTEGSAPPSTESPPSTSEEERIFDEVLGRLLSDLGLAQLDDPEADAEFADLLQDLIDSIKELVPAYQGRDVDIIRAIALLYRSGQAFQDSGFNDSVYECGAIDPVVACPIDVLDMPAGDTLVIATEVADPIPVESTERSYIYSVVFDTDRDPANDWVFVAPFEWDYFRGTDRWYQAIYDPGFGWTVDVVQLTATGGFPPGPTPSAARVVVDGHWVVWFIPIDELGGAPPPFRVSAFGHDGAFSENSRGGDVLGADPSEPLHEPPVVPSFVIEG